MHQGMQPRPSLITVMPQLGTRQNARASEQETFVPMSIDADYLVDRKRLQRRLSFWRVLAFVILLIALLAAATFSARDSACLPRSPAFC
jgi:hypothetical protein